MHPLLPKKHLLRNRSHLLIGKTGCGKTTLLFNLLFNMPYLDYGIAIVPSPEAYEDMCKVMPEAVVRQRIDMQPVDELLKNQQSFMRTRGNRKHRYLYLILDDVVSEKEVMNHPVMEQIAFRGRHYLLTTFITAQYINKVPKSIRGNINYIYQLREMSGENIDLLHKIYFSCVGNRAFFENVLQGNTEDRRCLVFDNVTSATSAEKCVYHYKGKKSSLLKFKVGCKSMYRIIARWLISKVEESKDFAEISREVMQRMNKPGEAPINDKASKASSIEPEFVRMDETSTLPQAAIRIV